MILYDSMILCYDSWFYDSRKHLIKHTFSFQQKLFKNVGILENFVQFIQVIAFTKSWEMCSVWQLHMLKYTCWKAPTYKRNRSNPSGLLVEWHCALTQRVSKSQKKLYIRSKPDSDSSDLLFSSLWFSMVLPVVYGSLFLCSLDYDSPFLTFPVYDSPWFFRLFMVLHLCSLVDYDSPV